MDCNFDKIIEIIKSPDASGMSKRTIERSIGWALAQEKLYFDKKNVWQSHACYIMLHTLGHSIFINESIWEFAKKLCLEKQAVTQNEILQIENDISSTRKLLLSIAHTLNEHCADSEKVFVEYVQKRAYYRNLLINIFSSDIGCSTKNLWEGRIRGGTTWFHRDQFWNVILEGCEKPIRLPEELEERANILLHQNSCIPERYDLGKEMIRVYTDHSSEKQQKHGMRWCLELLFKYDPHGTWTHDDKELLAIAQTDFIFAVAYLSHLLVNASKQETIDAEPIRTFVRTSPWMNHLVKHVLKGSTSTFAGKIREQLVD